MKIRLVGFRLKLKSVLTLDELMGALARQAGQRITHQKLGRIVAVKDLGPYYVGSLLTIKGGTKLTQIDVESLKMSVHELEQGQSLAVFNFFLLAKRNLHGL